MEAAGRTGDVSRQGMMWESGSEALQSKFPVTELRDFYLV